MAVELLSPGTHTFRAGEGILSYHVTPSKKENSRLWVQQAIAWGPGRNLYVKTLAPLLSEHFTVLDFSPRGSDESTRPKDAAGNDDPSQMSCTAMLDDLEALRQHLGLEAFGILSGHSQAGIPVLLYAALYPTRVQNLVAIGSGMLNFDQSQSFEHYRKIRSPLPPWKKSYEAWTQFQQTPPKTDEELREVLIEIMPSNLVNPDRDRDAVTTGLLDPAHLPRLWSYNAVTPTYATDAHATDMLDILSHVQARVLFLHGGQDMICSIEAVQIAKRNMRQGKAKDVRVDQFPVGHFPWIESKDEFLRGIFEFLGIEKEK